MTDEAKPPRARLTTAGLACLASGTVLLLVGTTILHLGLRSGLGGATGARP